MGGCLTFTIIGGVAEMVGFGLAFYELAVTQRREFPGRRPIHHRVIAWIRRRLRPPKTQAVEITAHGSARADGHAVVTIAEAPPITVEERLQQLEVGLQDLQAKQREDHAALEKKVGKATQRIDETESTLLRRLEAQESRRKEQLRESLFYERTGIGLFLVGVVFSVLGNAISC